MWSGLRGSNSPFRQKFLHAWQGGTLPVGVNPSTPIRIDKKRKRRDYCPDAFDVERITRLELAISSEISPRLARRHSAGRSRSVYRFFIDIKRKRQDYCPDAFNVERITRLELAISSEISPRLARRRSAGRSRSEYTNLY